MVVASSHFAPSHRLILHGKCMCGFQFLSLKDNIKDLLSMENCLSGLKALLLTLLSSASHTCDKMDVPALKEIKF